MLDVELFGLNPAAHHIVNVILHIANSVLVLFLLYWWSGALWRSTFVAALFALHPMHVESVAWIAERKDVLSACLGLLALLAYSKYAIITNSRTRGRWVWYGVALVLFALALMSKPMLVTLPFIMLLLDYWPLGRIKFTGVELKDARARNRSILSITHLLVEKIPFLMMTVACCVVTLVVQRASGATIPFDALPLANRLAQIPVSYLRYLGKTFWPDNLAVFYPYSLISPGSALSLTATLLLIGITVGVLVNLTRRPYFAVGWFWFIGVLVPVIGLVQVGRQSIADRYTYLPHIGLFIALTWLVGEVFERLRVQHMVRIAIAAVLVVACAVKTNQQVRVWKDTTTLARHATKVTRSNYLAHALLATALAAENKLDEAFAECKKALEINPNFAEAHHTMGMLLMRQGKSEDAINSYKQAIKCDPKFPDAYHGLAIVYNMLGKLREAEDACRAALQLSPLHLGAAFLLATTLHTQGKLDEAIATYQMVIKLKPDAVPARRGLANALVAKGDFSRALLEFERALEFEPENSEIRNSIGILLLSQGRVMEASNQFVRVLQRAVNDPIANHQIALLLITARKPTEAVQHFRRAIEEKPDWPEVLNDFAWLLAACPDPHLHDGQEAIRLAKRACELTNYKEPLLIGTLAAAYARAGQFTEAIKYAEQAYQLAISLGYTEIAKRNLELLELYRAGRAYAESP